MYCASCGADIPDVSRFCQNCGTATVRSERVLCRPQYGRKLAGVCAGIARYLAIDVTLVRIIMLVLAFWPPGVGVIIYIVCWIVMPREWPLLPPAPQRTAAQNSTPA